MSETDRFSKLLGFTPLHTAVSSRRRAEVERLLSKGADIDAVTTDGFTPLMLAARHRDADSVALLLEHGADPCIRDGKGRSAWQEAVRVKDRGTMDLLSAAGAAHHERQGSACALCHVPEAAFGRIECLPGSLAALEFRLAPIRRVHPVSQNVTENPEYWRPGGLVNGRILLMTAHHSATDANEAWEIREDWFTEAEHRLVGVSLRWSVAEGLNVFPFPLEREPTEKVLTRLRRSKIAASPADPSRCCDGASYSLRLEDAGAAIELHWQEEGPREWGQLVSAAREVWSFLEDRRTGYGGGEPSEWAHPDGSQYRTS